MLLSVTIDDPDLAARLASHPGTFDVGGAAQPLAADAVRDAQGASHGSMEKREESLAVPAPGTERPPARPWTSVHPDLPADDPAATLAALDRPGGQVQHASGRSRIVIRWEPSGHELRIARPKVPD